MEITPEDPNTTEKQDADDLARQACEHFNNGYYDKCLQLLNQLELANGNNNKLQLNRAVAKFYETGCMKHEQLLEELNGLSFEKQNTEPTNECIIAIYNKAVVYFHRHMYLTAIDTLAPLINAFEQLDNNTKTFVGLLMLRLLLATNQLKKALAFLEFMQNKLSLNTEMQLTESDDELAATDGSADTVAGAAAAEDEASTAETHENMEDLNRNLKLLAMLTNILNRKSVVVPDDGTAQLAALKAHQYYIMKDFQMAAKQFIRIKTDMHDSITNALSCSIANNMGVIHLRVRHYSIATQFFQNALKFDQQIAGDLHNATLHNMSAVRCCEILYNLGIAMLHLRRPKEAFKCFLAVLKTYHNNPRLWYRIAEVCIMDYEQTKQDLQNQALKNVKAVAPKHVDIINCNPTRKYCLATHDANGTPLPTLEFAAISLRNALTLAELNKHYFETQEEDEEHSNWTNVKDAAFCQPSQPISKVSYDNMLCAIYAGYSYVCLRLGDYVIAYEMAQLLLKMENLSGAYKMLGHMYAGEALIMLEKLPDARPHFEPNLIASLNEFDFETRNWLVKSVDAAQNIVRYNLAVAMALQHDYETAANILKNCKHGIVAGRVTPLQYFIDMKLAQKKMPR